MKDDQNLEKTEEQDERPPIRSIKDIEAEHPKEWVKIEITKMAEDGYTALEGRLIAYGKNRREVHESARKYIQKYHVKGTYSNYLGEIRAEAVLL